jgi:TatD DNase family protein
VELAAAHEGVHVVVGIHPSHAHEVEGDFLSELRALAADPHVAAIGEAGLDYHRLGPDEDGPAPAMNALGAGTTEASSRQLRDGSIKSMQAQVFTAQLDLAAELGLNVVVHQRDAWGDTLDLIRPYTGRLRAVFHCFGGTTEQAAELREMGHLVSFTGIVTFKNAGQVRETVAGLPDASYMVETDCPYLAPVPYRGARCEPWHTALVAAEIARVRGVSVERIAEETERTAGAFFRFS